MFRPAPAALLLVALTLAGCSWFADQESSRCRASASRCSASIGELEPDRQLASIPITLPRPVVNPDWPEPGGYPNHAMQHLALPYHLTQAWKTSIGDGSSRYTQVSGAAGRRRRAGFTQWMAAVQVGAYDAGERQSDLAGGPEAPSDYGNSFGGGVAFLEGSPVTCRPATPRYSRSIRPPAR